MAPGRDAHFLSMNRGTPTEVTIRGELIVMRPFDFLEARKAQALAADVLRELVDLYERNPQAHLDVPTFASVFERHNDEWVRLLAMACRRPPAWIYTLHDAEGMRLAGAFWATHSYLFTRLFLRMAAKRHRPQTRRRSAAVAFH